ncbi:hypothetical protein [Mesorhizobium captivum]|uniref:hypothetical protein n=1 Tax=Mesorhizobium captivum TaxID=3072319 RepID=UPI002A241E0A|nr:hypothetical protein [Mesorhizobium sp. VK3C]MDX8450868.1 hypothetical protein [Mesorhizobium sp. VK3C]
MHRGPAKIFSCAHGEEISVYVAVMLTSAVWRYRQRDMIGMPARLVVAALAIVALVLPVIS